MKFNSIIDRYLLRELVSPFLVNVVLFTFIFLTARILEITNLIVNYRVGLSVVLSMMAFSTPYFLMFVIPMSTMMAVLLTFLRLSADNEVLALKSGGVSVYTFVPPVLVFCLAGCLLTASISIYGIPWGRLSLKRLTASLASSHLDVALKERTFNDAFKDVMLYINRIDLKNQALIDVFVEDRRGGDRVSTVVAPRAVLYADAEGVYHLRLFDGTINQADLEKRSVHTVRFDAYDIRLDVAGAVAAAKEAVKTHKEMTLGELRQYVSSGGKADPGYHAALLELHRKFSIPVACFALGILAVPLGIQSKKAGRSFGLGVGLIFFLLYYLMLSAGVVFGEQGIYPPALGMWMPNLVMGAVGVYMLVRTANERPVGLGRIADWVRRRILRRRSNIEY